MHVAQDDLAGHFARGVAWSGIAKVIAQSVAWLSTLFVARYLSPTDYGLKNDNFTIQILYFGVS